MKVLLLNPAWETARAGARRYKRAWPPLDLLTSAALLRQTGHEPSLIDSRAAPTPTGVVRAAADRADLVLLQSSPIDRWQCPNLNWDILSRQASSLPPKKLVVAGAHGTVKPELILGATRAAALIRGEPERPLTALAMAEGDPRGIAGLSYPDSGRVVHEPDQDPVGLEELPPPAYDLIDPNDYAYELLGPRLALLETSRGCPFNCAFCLKAMYGPGVRTKSLNRVLAEVEGVVGGWGASSVYFIDLEFTLSRERIMDLCRGLIELNLDFKWCCQTRTDTVDYELLARMKEAGCALIHFGIETATSRLLETVRKKTTLDRARAAVDWCRGLGIETACFFLFGLPGETRADRRAAAALARQLDPTFASFHVAAPYPGTDLGGPAGEGEPFPACLADEHDLDELAREARRAFISFYLRPGYVRARLGEGTWPERLKRLRLFWEFVR